MIPLESLFQDIYKQSLWMDTLLHPKQVTYLKGAIVRVDQASHGWFPSQNGNRVDFLGLLEPVEQADVEALIRQYERAGVPRFFLYLLPIPGYQQVWHLLDSLEFRQGVELCVLVHELDEEIEPHDKHLTILKAKEPEELLQLLNHTGEPVPAWRNRPPDYADTPCILTLTGHEQEAAVATASLHIHEGVAYLGGAMTLPNYRGRGFQTALIRERLRIAKEYGCRFAYAATYDFVPPSYDNLMKNGFQERFRTTVFRYEMNPHHHRTLPHTLEGHMPPDEEAKDGSHLYR